MAAYLGIDLGTSGLKALVLAGDGGVVAEAEAPYTFRTPRPGWAEIDPREWERAMWAALERLGPVLGREEIGGIGLSGQMHATVLVDRHVQPVRPAVLWPDTRAAGVLDAWRALPDAVLAALANPIVAGMPGPVVRWIAEHEPAALERTATVLAAKDLLRHHLVPVVATERSDACATLLWDVPGDTWSPAALGAAGLPAALLPPVVGSAHVVGVTDQLAARLPGGDATVPVVAGGGDTPLALAAVAAVPGPIPRAVVNLGTGAQVLVPDVGPSTVAPVGGHLYADSRAGWYTMAALQNGGLALDWVRGVLGWPWDRLIEEASARPVGAGGVSFHPFLSGERGGVAGPSSRGGWTGLGTSTGPGDLARAAVEGVAFAIGHVVAATGIDQGPVRVTGGLGREPLLRSVLATVAGRELHHVGLRSASAVGAALLAAGAVGDAITPRATLEMIEPSGGGVGEVTLEAYERWCDRLAVAEL